MTGQHANGVIAATMMRLANLSKTFDGKRVIDDVSLEVGEDEYVTVLGPSGAGKSVLLRLIAGLEWPDGGTIALDGGDITHTAAHLRGLGFVQQRYALFPHLSVEENVAFGLRNRAMQPVRDEAQVREKVERMLALVGLDGLGGRMVGQISGGQKQRVSLARTLVAEPRICLLDEPLGALDANLRERMTVELRRIRETLGVTFVHATGNETEALAMGDRLLVLADGRALQTAPPDDVYQTPATADVARAVNAYNLFDGAVHDGAFVVHGTPLALPFEAPQARRYAIRFGLVEIEPTGATAKPGRGAVDATFVASEFIGSRVVYVFRGPGGAIVEVERHLSVSDPVDFRRGETRKLSWSLADVLLFDGAGGRIAAEIAREAA